MGKGEERVPRQNSSRLEPFEKSGQYVNGTVFIEGMVYFKHKWFLYYGCADSRVAVAVYDPAKPAGPDQVD